LPSDASSARSDFKIVGGRRFAAVSPDVDLLGEGPVWSSRQGHLFWVDILNNKIKCLDPSADRIETWTLDDTTGSLACHAEGGLLVALGQRLVAFDTIDGRTKEVAPAESRETVPWRYNDGKCDPLGRFFVGRMPMDPDVKAGSLCRFDPDRGMIDFERDLQVPNGLAWSPDGATMYFADSRAKTIYAYRYDLSSGTPHDRRVFARTTDGVPDGATVDSEGFLWSAEYGAGRINRFSPDGRLHSQLLLPVQYPTSCAFGGSDLRTLFVTSATIKTNDAGFASHPLSGHLIAIELEVAGRTEPEFDRMRK
jgi:sugar lactone lactonase YvrE